MQKRQIKKFKDKFHILYTNFNYNINSKNAKTILHSSQKNI